jgi:hypothetical protein
MPRCACLEAQLSLRLLDVAVESGSPGTRVSDAVGYCHSQGRVGGGQSLHQQQAPSSGAISAVARTKGTVEAGMLDVCFERCAMSRRL